MDFSLVLGTLGRPVQLRRLLDSLCMQAPVEVEAVIVDQSEAEEISALVAMFETRLPLVHMRSSPGVSRARNAGLRHARGAIIGFPDDDCWYPGGLLNRVMASLTTHPDWDGLTGRAVDETGVPSVGRWGRRSGFLTGTNLWWRAVSTTVFLRREVVEKTGPFDESLGIGSGTPWGSGEELDLLLRALKVGCRIYFDPTLEVLHPRAVSTYDADAAAKAYRYGAGVGRVIRKHRCPHWFAAYMVGRPLAGALAAAAMGSGGRARYLWSGFRGRVAGWLSGAAG